MLRLDRAITKQGHQAPITPNMYGSLANDQVAIRRGEVSMVAGPPGAGKSTIALALALRAQVPTLYFSADTHSHTMALRLVSMITSVEQAQAEPAMETHPDWVKESLREASHIRWCFDSAPSMRSIEDELAAHEELMGEAPDLVVIDNLMDCVGGEGDEWGSLRSLMKDFKYLAREHDCAFLVLHHTSESYNLQPGNVPPLRALQGKVGQTAALVLSVSNQQAGFLHIGAVKNRYGPADPSGFSPKALYYNPAAMYVADPTER